MKTILRLTLAIAIFANAALAQSDTTQALKLIDQARTLGDAAQFDSATSLINEAIDIFKNTGNSQSIGMAEALYFRGLVRFKTGLMEDALGDFGQSLDIKKKILGADNEEVVNIMGSMGNIYAGLGMFEESLELSRGCLVWYMKNKGESHPKTAALYQNIGLSLCNMGFNSGIDTLLKSLRLKLAIPRYPPVELARTYYNIGVQYNSMRDYENGLLHHQKAISIRFEHRPANHPETGLSYLGLGESYIGLDELDQAAEQFSKSLEILVANFDSIHPDVAFALNSLGIVYYLQDQYEHSLQVNHQALSILNEILPPGHPQFADVLYYIGEVEYRLGRYDSSIVHLKESFETGRQVYGDVHPQLVPTLIALGNCYSEQGRQDSALFYYDSAIRATGFDGKDFESANDAYLLAMALNAKGRFLSNLAEEAAEKENLRNALEYLSKAMAALDFKRRQLMEGASRESLSSKTLLLYEQYIQTNLSASHANLNKEAMENIFHAVEKSKSMALYESMAGSRALLYAGIPEKIIHAENTLRQDISELEVKRNRALERSGPETEALVNNLNSQIFDLRQSHAALLAKMEKDFPAYYSLKYGLSVTTLTSVQNDISPTSTLLEYFTGDSSIFLFVINKDNYQVKEIPKDFPLETWVRQLQYGLSTYHALPPKAPLRENFAFRDSCTRAYITAAQNLYDKLVKPVKTLLKEEIIIVPDGVLGYVPFEALLTGPSPADINRYHRYPYLLREHRIRYTYSATLLKEMMDKKHRHEPEKRFAAFAPYYDGDTSVLAGLDALFTRRTVTSDALSPLKYSGPEVLAAQNLMGGDVFLDSTATEERFNQVAGNYRILHLSTHGKADDRVGDYAYLVFSPQKDSIENELLYCRDIYNLTLNADLVVLSACETGIGKLSRGEGIISLARAFAYAGAKSIVNSLWSVNDISTQDLMIRFYENLKAGKSKSEALALAKRKFLEVPSDKEQERYQKLDLQWEDFRHPYFWGGFILMGDDAAVR